MDCACKRKLIELADKYETCRFTEDDPSCVLRRYTGTADIEAAAFIAAVLSFGQRAQFMKKIEYILSASGAYPAEWLRSGVWKKQFPEGTGKFYRFYSYNDMRDVFSALQRILSEDTTFGQYMKKRYEERIPHMCLASLIAAAFPGCRAVSRTPQSAGKRINMFLRWMVRRNSPVDLGLWTWYSPEDLIIPLDTHVLQEAEKIGLVPPGSAGTAKTARLLTDQLRGVWPDDPCRGDYALFGAGIDGQCAPDLHDK
jgi:uncharacterized protein (TIGR02757 family)